MFIEAIFTIAKIWNQPKCPPINECIKTHTYKYFKLLFAYWLEFIFFFPWWMSNCSSTICQKTMLPHWIAFGMYVCSVAQLCSTLRGPKDCSPPSSSIHRIFPDKNTEVGCHFLLQEIFLIQWLSARVLHWQAGSLLLPPLGKPPLPFCQKSMCVYVCVCVCNFQILHSVPLLGQSIWCQHHTTLIAVPLH